MAGGLFTQPASALVDICDPPVVLPIEMGSLRRSGVPANKSTHCCSPHCHCFDNMHFITVFQSGIYLEAAEKFSNECCDGLWRH